MKYPFAERVGDGRRSERLRASSRICVTAPRRNAVRLSTYYRLAAARTDVILGRGDRPEQMKAVLIGPSRPKLRISRDDRTRN
jgi:hypothetical protein